MYATEERVAHYRFTETDAKEYLQHRGTGQYVRLGTQEEDFRGGDFCWMEDGKRHWGDGKKSTTGLFSVKLVSGSLSCPYWFNFDSSKVNYHLSQFLRGTSRCENSEQPLITTDIIYRQPDGSFWDCRYTDLRDTILANQDVVLRGVRPMVNQKGGLPLDGLRGCTLNKPKDYGLRWSAALRIPLEIMEQFKANPVHLSYNLRFNATQAMHSRILFNLQRWLEEAISEWESDNSIQIYSR